MATLLELEQRVESLEQLVVDMQATIDTLSQTTDHAMRKDIDKAIGRTEPRSLLLRVLGEMRDARARGELAP